MSTRRVGAARARARPDRHAPGTTRLRVTDHLIPLFAVGALLAFTLSQAGMVAYWRRHRDRGRLPRMVINGVGTVATTAALGVVLVSKFSHGAWVIALIIPALVVAFERTRRYNDALESITRAEGPLDVSHLGPPIVVIPLRRLDQVGRKAIRFALTISPDIYVVQVQAEELDTEDLHARWRTLVAEPVQHQLGRRPPQLVLIRSAYRQFFGRFLAWLHQLIASSSDRSVIVLIPELVQRRWYQLVVSHRALRLKARLLFEGGPRVSVMSTPWYADVRPRRWRRAVDSRRRV